MYEILSKQLVTRPLGSKFMAQNIIKENVTLNLYFDLVRINFENN